MSFPSDLEIARKAELKPLGIIAKESGIPEESLELYGEGAAKIKLDAIDSMANKPKAKYVVVTAITPTPLGEGKTTTTVGLGQGFSHIGKRATIAIHLVLPSELRVELRVVAMHKSCQWSFLICI